MGYRDRLDIIADILQAARDANVKKTRIMFQANLSYKVLQRYLSNVVEASLLSFDRFQNYYTLTDKGRTFLNTYTDYSQSSRNAQKIFSDIQSKRVLLEKLCGNGSNGNFNNCSQGV